MRYTYEQMKSMLQGAYKKLKSYYFYDKTLLFIKKKIAEFESDDGCFQQTFDVLAKALISENSAYFEELIDQLDYRVFPKRLVAASAPTSTIVGTIDHHKNIAKVNFFIDVPIELLILDCLWTLCIAKIINIKNNATIFPIGLLSPILLRELYLYAFDQRIKFALNPTHYGRYVDDMIIIIPAEVQANNVTQNYVCNLLKEKGLIRKKISIQNEDFTFVGFESIAIQREKINCF